MADSNGNTNVAHSAFYFTAIIHNNTEDLFFPTVRYVILSSSIQDIMLFFLYLE